MDTNRFEEVVKELKTKIPTDTPFVLILVEEHGAQVGSNLNNPNIVHQLFIHLADSTPQDHRIVHAGN